jgi:hypothetical protein
MLQKKKRGSSVSRPNELLPFKGAINIVDETNNTVMFQDLMQMHRHGNVLLTWSWASKEHLIDLKFLYVPYIKFYPDFP